MFCFVKKLENQNYVLTLKSLDIMKRSQKFEKNLPVFFDATKGQEISE